VSGEYHEHPEPTLNDALEAVERLQTWDPLDPKFKKVRMWHGTSSTDPAYLTSSSSGIPKNLIPPSGGSGYCPPPKKLCRNCPSRIPGSKFQELTQRVEKLEALFDLFTSNRESIEGWKLCSPPEE
jgi:hypothetical protein